MQRIISVDSGRSSVKTVNESFEKLIIEARHGQIDFNKSKRSPFAMFNPRTDIIAAVDDGPANVYGKFVETMLAPEDIQYVTEDRLYLEYAKDYILVSIAKMVTDGDTVVFSGNLTTNNFKYIDDFVKTVIGNHVVTFYDPRGKIVSSTTFTVTNAVVIPQGQSSLMSLAIKDDLSYNEKYFKMGLGIDLGRRTVCTLLFNRLNILKDRSFDIQDGVGMESLYHIIKEELFEKHNLRYSNFDIERILVNNEGIFGRDGNPIDLVDLKARAILKVSERVRNNVMESFGEYVPSFVFLTGGGVYLLGDTLKKMFPTAEILEDPVWTNAVGLERLALKGMKSKAQQK